jgi:hypothetical protein
MEHRRFMTTFVVGMGVLATVLHGMSMSGAAR